jgi:hypothetical protein
MNARQMKKCLKKQIDRLQKDNDLMRRIIADSPHMQELYDVYTKPLNVTATTRPFKEFRVKRMIPLYMADIEGTIEYTKRQVAVNLFECIEDNITYEIDDGLTGTSITGSIVIGEKKGAS